MTSLAPNASADAAIRTPVPTLWGLGVQQLHDRFWAARCVQVVRCGSGKSIEIGPQLYLLLDASTLLLFKTGRLLDRLRWLKPRSVRLRLVDHHERSYQERVLSDDQGRFLAIRRAYRAGTRAIGRAWLTEDRELAAQWARATSFDVANAAMKSSQARGTILPWRENGMAVNDDDDVPRIQRELIRTWEDPRRAIDTVYSYEPGVWVHESVRVPPGVRFVPPVWVGADAKLRPGQVVVGPTVVADAGLPPTFPSPIDWNDAAAHPRLMDARKSVTRLARSWKRVFDIGFSLAAICCTLPIYPVVMAAIYLEDGRPFFFAHRRQTLFGREFPCVKFRTMIKNAESIKADLVSANVCDGAHFYIKDDPRVTRVGRVLRKFHLDELPQFWNVLVGHMSVVGPRPSPDKENQYCPAWREARLSVRPGVTGLWQVRRTRAQATDFQEWVRYDLEYVQRRSFGLDVRIIIDTILQIVRH